MGSRDVNAGEVRSGSLTPDGEDGHVAGINSLWERELQRCVQDVTILRESPVISLPARTTRGDNDIQKLKLTGNNTTAQ